MAKDFDNVVAGPASLLLDDVELGHTQGGIEATFTPKNRPRVVDKFGESECAIIHQGDECRLSIPLAEWTAESLKAVYEPGNDQTGAGGDKYLGFGRSAGYIYQPADAKIVPILAADAGRKIHIYKAVPIGEIKLPFKAEDDRIFQTEWAGLVDESKTDGELIGKIYLSSTVPTTTTSP